jgi:hypothetical protein
MKKLIFASVLGASLCSVAAYADDISGYISDAHCGAKHSAPSAANTKCIVDMCMKNGSDPVLVSNGKVMKFDDASKEKAKAFGGQNVKIDGSMTGDLVTVNSIDKAQ